ncbi:MAG TPA: DUF4382 domain-containing protein [Myxococcaceae bacterium]|nr:DUF4382 domain-containing protein [Myxococcaceae bacterium]
MPSRLLRSRLAAATALAIAGCGAGTSSANGILAVELVDAPSPDVKGIVVTIDTVTAHSEQAGWVTVAHGPITVDLLTLQDVAMKLGEVSLPAGMVGEVRLQLVADGPQYVLLADGTHAPLKAPSGATSGEKLKGPFTVSACSKHTLTIDFDGKNSIAYHETGGPNPEWILRPVIRVKSEAVASLSCAADAGTSDSGTPGGSDAGQDGGTGAGTTDGGFHCDPSDPSCPT